MKFANIRDLRLDTNSVLKLSEKEGPVVILRNSRPVAVLKSVTEEVMEIKVNTLWPKLRNAAERAGYGLHDVEKLIRRVRRGRGK